MTRSAEIRILTAYDVELMRGVLAMFGAAFEDLPRYTERQPDNAYLAGLLANPDFIAVAAVSADTVAGGLTAYVLPKYEQARSEVYIFDLAVDERFRRRGIATALIRTLQQAAAMRGASVVFVQADREDEPAIALYSKLGTRRDVLHFEFEVPDGVPGPC